VEWVDFVLGCWRDREYGLTEKSRDCGISTLAMALACTLCIFEQEMAVGLGSVTEIKIDRSGDPDTLFYKARVFMQNLPHEFRAGWELDKNSAHLRMSWPGSGSSLTGEAGDGIGRGGRKSIYFVDESAHLERPHLIDASLASNTNCRQDISSVAGMANPFAKKRHEGKIRVFTFSYLHDPRKGPGYLDDMKKKLDTVTLNQEVLMNYAASAKGAVIPHEWVQAAIGAREKLGLGEPTGAKRGALDVADEGTDLNAFAGRHGVHLQHLVQWSGKGSDIFETVEATFGLCLEGGYTDFDYDADGLGAGVRGDARIINKARTDEGLPVIQDTPFRGSAAVVNPEDEQVPERKNKDFFSNLKAQSWWHLRFLFQETFRAVNNINQDKEPYDPDKIITIDPFLEKLAELTMELAQPTYKLNTAGKIVIDKTPDGMRSPNLADAVMICYNPQGRDFEAWAKL
jgi:hypothetical protein